MTSEAGTVVYYPSFRPSTGWLKRALLFWDRVRCIVPQEAESYVDRKGDYRDLEETGCLKNTDPSHYLEGARDSFEFVLYRGGIRRAMGPLTRIMRSPRDDARRQGQLLSKDPRFVDFAMHFRKMHEDLIYQLESAGMCRRTPDGEWVQVSGPIASIYMLCLADAIGRRLKAPIGTAYPEFHRLGEQLRFGDSPHVDVAEYALIRLGINFPSEMIMRNKSINWLLRFRERHAVLRQSFREKILSIVRDISNLTDRNQRDDLLHSIRLEKDAAHAEYLRRLSENRVISSNSLLTISIPSLIPATMAAIGAPPLAVVVAGAAAVTIGAAAVYTKSSRESRDAAGASPWNYAACLGRAVGYSHAGAK
jgi:hypothetical protein